MLSSRPERGLITVGIVNLYCFSSLYRLHRHRWSNHDSSSNCARWIIFRNGCPRRCVIIHCGASNLAAAAGNLHRNASRERPVCGSTSVSAAIARRDRVSTAAYTPGCCTLTNREDNRRIAGSHLCGFRKRRWDAIAATYQTGADEPAIEADIMIETRSSNCNQSRSLPRKIASPTE